MMNKDRSNDSIAVNIGIVGQGAIGVGLAQLIAHRAAYKQGDNIHVSLWLRRLNEQALTITQTLCSARKTQTARLSTQQQLQSPKDFAQYLLDDAAALQRLHLLVLPVKFYQLAAVIAQLKAHLPKHVALLLLQNGMGGHQQLAKAFPDNPLYLGTTTDAIQRITENDYKVHARGELLIGSEKITRPCAAITQLINMHPQGKWVEQIIRYLYKKLAVNAVINPLTAIHACTNGEILAYKEDIACLKAEIRALYRALQLDLDFDALDAYIDSVIVLTKHNYSSMYQDVKHHRPTEVDGILGTLQAQAAQHGLAVPTIDKLYQQLKALEQTYS